MSLLLKGLGAVGRGLVVTFRIAAPPIRWILRMVFALVLVSLYKLYLVVRLRLAALWRPAKNKILFPLSTRYVVHAIVILLLLFVTTNSMKAREIRQEQPFQPSLLSALISRDVANDPIIERATTPVTKEESYHGGIGGISPLDVTEALATEAVAATQENSSLIKPELSATTATAQPRQDVLYHAVEGGETIGSIAEQYNISINTVLWENKLGPRDYIQPGQKLTVLPMTGISYQIQKGDTLAAIASKYEGDVSEILDFNKLPDASAISAGEILLIPRGRIPPPPAPAPAVRLAIANGSQDNNYSNTPPPNARGTGKGLLWPTISRRINQYFTYRHTGIDIDGDFGTPIYAADDGRVAFVGWSRGYGLNVIIDHGNGMQTLYAHASKSYVKVGQNVSKGQTIAAQGLTGWTTGVHVHFEVHINGRQVNPFSYL